LAQETCKKLYKANVSKEVIERTENIYEKHKNTVLIAGKKSSKFQNIQKGLTGKCFISYAVQCGNGRDNK
jgi:hypothetical protein